MMAFQRQNWQTSDSGILRKKDENEEELLVFGYSCKLFRDDEKALYVDQGKHLIPWMGDESLRIDRYDVRGALYDLSQYEAISGHQEELFWINLSNEERRIEQLCDEERYRALTHNEDEEALYQEEELKRLHQALGSDKTYGQVSYSYDNENGEAEKQVQETNQTEDVDEPFVPSPELEIPQDMVIPETVKLNAIIEKTVMFIIQQGAQMEIILKMKQASNPQFEFLSYNSALQPYYRHLFAAVKSGKYKPKVQTNNTTENKTNEENPADQNYYLHHSLSQVPTSSVNVAPLIPNINYKPSSDCAYSMLVNKIKGKQSQFNLLNKPIEMSKETVVTAEKVIENVKFDNPDISSSPHMYNPLEIPQEQSEEENDNVKHSSLVLNLPYKSVRKKRRKRQQGAFAYNDALDEESIDGMYFETGSTEIESQKEEEPVTTADSIPSADVPPPDIQLIIDKMAKYVAKNGREFEAIVRSKDDPRFYFLDPSNQYNDYYRKQVEYFEQSQKQSVDIDDNNSMDGDSSRSYKDNSSLNNGDVDSTNTSNDKKKSNLIKPNPVCFSIKRPKETESLEIKSALPLEESSEDEEGEDGTGNNKETNNENNNDVVEEVNVVMKNTVDDKTNSVEKCAEERVKDKSTTNKDKSASKAKDKQLQLERKKRAAAFLNLIQKVNKPSSISPEKSTPPPIMIGPQLPDNFKTDDKSDSGSGEVDDDDEEDDDDDSSISSLPSSVTSPEVTIISDTAINLISPKEKSKESKVTESSTSSSSHRNKLKHYNYSSDHVRNRDNVEYRHKHRKRKRSRSPISSNRRHHVSSSHSRPHYHRSSNHEGKHRKHHRHRKERYHSDREYNSSRSSHFHHKDKRYKSKKHKRKDDKKYAESSSGNSDSE